MSLAPTNQGSDFWSSFTNAGQQAVTDIATGLGRAIPIWTANAFKTQVPAQTVQPSYVGAPAQPTTTANTGVQPYVIGGVPVSPMVLVVGVLGLGLVVFLLARKD